MKRKLSDASGGAEGGYIRGTEGLKGQEAVSRWPGGPPYPIYVPSSDAMPHSSHLLLIRVSGLSEFLSFFFSCSLSLCSLILFAGTSCVSDSRFMFR